MRMRGGRKRLTKRTKPDRPVRGGALRREPRPGRADYNAYIGSAAWAARRALALAAAGHRCQICNSVGTLDVHHRTYARFGQEDPGDLTVLCGECHRLYHGRVAAERADPHPDLWDRTMDWAVAELRCALREAIDAMSWDHMMYGRFGAALASARRSEERVTERLHAMHRRWYARRGIHVERLPKGELLAPGPPMVPPPVRDGRSLLEIARGTGRGGGIE